MRHGSASRILRSAGQGLVCLFVLTCALVSSVLNAQEPVLTAPGATLPAPPSAKAPLVPLSEALDTRGDLSLQNTTIQKALFTIGATWNVNIVVGKEVDGTVSCIYTQAPLREVLDAILLANGYSYRAVGESLVVQKASEVGSANPLFRSAAISISHSDLNEVVEGARLLLSTQGQLQAMESANSILVVDFADRVETIRDFVAQMDSAASQTTGGVPAESYKRLQVAYFHTQYIPVDNTKGPLTSVLSATGRIATMPAENRLVIVDYPSNIDMARRVLEKIDRPRPQVRITGLIYDISLSDVEQLGLNWGHSAKGNNLDGDGNAQQAITLETTTMQPFGATAPGGGFTVRSLTRNFDIEAVLLALQNAKDARLLADPNVTVEENEMASMDSVQEIPFQMITQSELGGQIGTTQFKPVGIKLNVTPQIASDGTVQMIVNQEFSRVAGFTENDEQPIIDKRVASTSVRVANKQTIVIGGLRQRSDTGDFNGIPWLKDVKVVGPLFRSRDTNVRESELLVFLQPEIVDYDQVMRSREFMALETINCRLDGIPRAEGCPPPANCEPCVEPIAFPPIESEFNQLPPDPNQQGAVEQTSNNVPLRPGYDNRYRTTGDSAPLRQPHEERQAEKKPSVWKRMWGK
jgi:general secretion pathway protein D